MAEDISWALSVYIFGVCLCVPEDSNELHFLFSVAKRFRFDMRKSYDDDFYLLHHIKSIWFCILCEIERER
jgi:hypothetical protein